MVFSYQTVLRFENQPLPDTPENVLKSYCSGMRILGERSMPGVPADAQERAEQPSKILKPNEMIFLGVVAEEPLVCFGATLQKVKLLTDEENPRGGDVRRHDPQREDPTLLPICALC
jgi:hypothetical protein